MMEWLGKDGTTRRERFHQGSAIMARWKSASRSEENLAVARRIGLVPTSTRWANESEQEIIATKAA